MGRSEKVTVEWFPHQVHHKITIHQLRKLFKHEGYAFWFMLLEVLGKTPNHVYDYNSLGKKEYLSDYVDLPETRCNEILDVLAELDAIDKDLWINNKIIWSDNFVEGLNVIYAKRSTSSPTKPKLISVPKKVENLQAVSEKFGNKLVPLNKSDEIINNTNQLAISEPKKVENLQGGEKIPPIRVECIDSSILDSSIFKESEANSPSLKILLIEFIKKQENLNDKDADFIVNNYLSKRQNGNGKLCNTQGKEIKNWEEDFKQWILRDKEYFPQIFKKEDQGEYLETLNQLKIK